MSISINAVKRDVKGTGASRRARRAGNVPGVVYGGNAPAVNLEMNLKELFLQFRHEAFHASILDLILDGKKESVLLRNEVVVALLLTVIDALRAFDVIFVTTKGWLPWPCWTPSRACSRAY